MSLIQKIMELLPGLLKIVGIIILVLVIGNILFWGFLYLAFNANTEDNKVTTLAEYTCGDTTLKLNREHEVSMGRGEVESLFLEFSIGSSTMTSSKVELNHSNAYARNFPMHQLVGGDYWLSSSFTGDRVEEKAWNVYLSKKEIPENGFEKISACLAAHENEIDGLLQAFTPTKKSSPEFPLWVPQKINSLSALSDSYYPTAFICTEDASYAVYITATHGSDNFNLLRGTFDEHRKELLEADYYWWVSVGDDLNNDSVTLEQLLSCTNRDGETLKMYIDRYKEILSENNL